MEYKDTDWYVDENGIIWEMNFDIDNNVHRWFEVDPDYYIPHGDEVEPPKKEK